jgi:acetyl-CoA carboxylase biotin carboxylase subunit
VFKKILIANRGEIAIRIMRTCRELGIKTVAVHSEADAAALHVQMADEVVPIGPPPATESYLKMDALINAARHTGAEAIHPGYGFLSENSLFAHKVQEAGLVFIGPAPEALAAVGDKVLARRTVAKAGVPVIPAIEEPSSDPALLRAQVRQVGYPVLIKAAAGGGGKGMRLVRQEEELAEALAAAQREAAAAFGVGQIYLEKYLERPRHIEVQILGDPYGHLIHLGERECSIQRRYQKILEETPCPAVSEQLRRELTSAALRVAKAAGYYNAGTVEFILDQQGHFYFLEVNARLQVEHPITEWVTGVDLVREQLGIAAGERLSLTQEEIRPRGHALECRIYAEDPANHFFPSVGKILFLAEPTGPGVRVDSGVERASEVSIYYDPLIAKISTWGKDRESARHRMLTALHHYAILGLTTNIEFLLNVLRHSAFVAAETHTGFIPEHFPRWHKPITEHTAEAVIAVVLSRLQKGRKLVLSTAEGRTVRESGSVDSPWQSLGSWRVGV